MSGGPDSTALMHALAAWPDRPSLLVATVDHGLRPEARAEAEAVRAQAAALGLPHAILVWENPPSDVSQEAAREARYALLTAQARAVGATRLATAHTLDDQAETILMRLAAGSGLSGLAGMATRVPRDHVLHLRPFLGLRKDALVATCRARGWRFSEDPTNLDARFARPRWRALADLLSAEGLTPERIGRLGLRLARADAALGAMADAVAAETIEIIEEVATSSPSPLGAVGRVVCVDLVRLAGEPEEIALRVLLRALELVGADTVRLDRAEAALAALLGARCARMPMRQTLAGRLLALDRRGVLRIAPEPPRRRGR